jgi:membrane-associated protein
MAGPYRRRPTGVAGSVAPVRVRGVTDPMILTPLLLGLDWMDPEWLLERFGSEMFWVSVAIVFAECGLLFPILPGDSLLFSIGLFVHRAEAGEPGIDINIVVACVILSAAAFLGNVVGYEIGRAIGEPLAHREGRFIKKKYFDQTHAFFERYGARALVLGRFVPIVRTFITVVAGIGKMDRRHFFTWSFVGAVLWATGLTLLGYFLGGIDFLQHNLEATVLVIVAVSVLPMVYELVKHRREIAEEIDELQEPDQR